MSTVYTVDGACMKSNCWAHINCTLDNPNLSYLIHLFDNMSFLITIKSYDNDRVFFKTTIHPILNFLRMGEGNSSD